MNRHAIFTDDCRKAAARAHLEHLEFDALEEVKRLAQAARENRFEPAGAPRIIFNG